MINHAKVSNIHRKVATMLDVKDLYHFISASSKMHRPVFRRKTPGIMELRHSIPEWQFF